MTKTCPFNPAHSCKRDGCAWWVTDETPPRSACAIPCYLRGIESTLDDIREILFDFIPTEPEN
jgi:hypothetical protein